MTRSGLALAHLSSRTLFSSIALLMAAGFFAPLEAQFGNGYDFRREIDVVDAQVIGGAHANFPVLVADSLDDLRTTANGGKVENANGYDIIFTSDLAGTTQLAHEIEAYNPATGDFTIWVRVESLVATTKIYMFYGNSSIGTFQGNVTSNGVTGVWDNDFLTVLHLHDDFLDATSNGNDVTNSGSTDIAGKIGDGQDFDGVNDRLADEDAELFINGLTAVTVELWIKSDVTGTDRGFMETEEPDSTDDILALRYDVAGSDGGGANVIKAAIIVGSGENDLESSINVQTTNWQHVVYSWSSGNAPSLYLDGGVDTPTSAPAAQSGAITGATKLLIGEGPKDTGGSSGWDGKIDEVRISGVARAAQWIQTEYNNQNSPGSFLTVGSEQDGTGPDGTAPADVTALATGTVTTSSVALSWTAPGDDGATGTATTYDVRYSTSTITAGNWASATQATGEPAPSVAGSAESFTVTGLSEGTTYYFAIKTSDEVPNESALSNVPSATPDGTAPADVTDLATGTVTTSSVALSWTAPGDDGATGTATTYDVRYSTSTITAGNWASATQATGEPSPSVAGSAETFTVTGLSESTTHYFAIKTSDEVPNESALSNVPSAATATTAPATVTALATGTVTATSVALSWTAPGDDGATGTATTYDVRYSTSTITAGNWASATQATGEPAPSVAGSAETFTVTGLSDENTTYYFAIKTSDEVPNESALSNVPSTATATTAPDAVTDLTGTVTASSVALSWTAPGDDGATGTATTYDVRYSTSTITAGNWASATQATGEPAPQVAGSAETFTVTGLSVATTYYFAIKTSDEVPNESALSNVLSAATARTLTLPLYLEGDAVTTASLTATAPSQSSLPNYDPGRNSDAGLLLTKSSLGVVSEADAIKYQIWVDAAGPVEINGPVVLGFWSAVKDFPTDKRGIVDAGLFECDTDGTNCSVIVQGSLDQTPWSSSGTWASYNIDFGTVSHTVQAGKALAVKVTIGNSADDNMWLAYWTTAYPAQLGTSALDGTAPDAVTDLATGTVTTSSVALSWTAPGDDGATGTATTYDVRYSTSTITAGNWASATPATGEPAPSAAGSAETFTVTGLSESTTYFFAIKTSDELPNESGLSNVPSSATATTAPDAVTDLATGTVTTSSVALSWTAPGDDGATGTATTYDVRYSTSTITAGNWASATPATGEPAPSVAGSAETFTVTGLSNESTTYYFAIKTSDEVPNESTLSNVPSSATATTAPDAVTDLATGTVTTSSVALSWTAPGDDGATGTATTYDVRYSTSTITAGNWASATQATGEPAPSVAGSAETFTVTGLSESTTYYFAIKTSDEVPNESAISNVPSTATADGTAPADVTDLATGTVTTSSVALSWTAPGDDGATGTATTYDVRYSTSTITAGNWASATQATGEPAPSVAGSAETFTVTGLSESTTYFFAIKTSDEEPNESGLSNVPSTATATTAPDAVTDLATGTVTTSSVALSWTAPGDDGATGTATTYDVRYSTSTITAGNWASATQAAGEPAPSVAGSAETFTVTGLSESTTYYFAIKTSDEVPNESAISNVPSTATADGSAPADVTDLATGTVTTSSVALSWTAPGDDGATGTATTYDVRYSTSTITAGNWATATQATGEPSPSVAGSAETFTVTGLSESTTYYFAIKTSDDVPNESALSNVPSSATATTAPADVINLATGTVTTSSVALSWTAPGDDGATGTATTYDVRYSTSTITAGNWASATQAAGEPAPSVAGSAETFTVTGLSESTTYYFAIKTSDEVPNESALSNVPSTATADGTAPAAVTDLATGTVTTSSVALSWTAPGDDGATGTATTYDVRYSTSTITAGNWATATQATGEPAPSVAGSAETFTVTGLSESTTYYFAIKDLGRSTQRERALERAELRDSHHCTGRRRGPGDGHGDGDERGVVVDGTRRRRSHRDRDHLRRALLDEHDQRRQLGVCDAGDGRACPVRSG